MEAKPNIASSSSQLPESLENFSNQASPEVADEENQTSSAKTVSKGTQTDIKIKLFYPKKQKWTQMRSKKLNTNDTQTEQNIAESQTKNENVCYCAKTLPQLVSENSNHQKNNGANIQIPDEGTQEKISKTKTPHSGDRCDLRKDTQSSKDNVAHKDRHPSIERDASKKIRRQSKEYEEMKFHGRPLIWGGMKCPEIPTLPPGEMLAEPRNTETDLLLQERHPLTLKLPKFVKSKENVYKKRRHSSSSSSGIMSPNITSPKQVKISHMSNLKTPPHTSIRSPDVDGASTSRSLDNRLASMSRTLLPHLSSLPSHASAELNKESKSSPSEKDPKPRRPSGMDSDDLQNEVFRILKK